MAKYLSLKIPSTEEKLLEDARKKYSRENPGVKNYDYKVLTEALRRYVGK